MLPWRILLSEQVHLHSTRCLAQGRDKTVLGRRVLAIADDHAVGVGVLRDGGDIGLSRGVSEGASSEGAPASASGEGYRVVPT